MCYILDSDYTYGCDYDNDDGSDNNNNNNLLTFTSDSSNKF
jgi:hypothetical protein